MSSILYVNIAFMTIAFTISGIPLLDHPGLQFKHANKDRIFFQGFSHKETDYAAFNGFRDECDPKKLNCATRPLIISSLSNITIELKSQVTIGHKTKHYKYIDNLIAIINDTLEYFIRDDAVIHGSIYAFCKAYMLDINDKFLDGELDSKEVKEFYPSCVSTEISNIYSIITTIEDIPEVVFFILENDAIKIRYRGTDIVVVQPGQNIDYLIAVDDTHISYKSERNWSNKVNWKERINMDKKTQPNVSYVTGEEYYKEEINKLQNTITEIANKYRNEKKDLASINDVLINMDSKFENTANKSDIDELKKEISNLRQKLDAILDRLSTTEEPISTSYIIIMFLVVGAIFVTAVLGAVYYCNRRRNNLPLLPSRNSGAANQRPLLDQHNPARPNLYQ